MEGSTKRTIHIGKEKSIVIKNQGQLHITTPHFRHSIYLNLRLSVAAINNFFVCIHIKMLEVQG